MAMGSLMLLNELADAMKEECGMTEWSGLGICPGEILLPGAVHLNSHWPVVALDQYTSQPEVWEEAALEIGEAPSTLNLIIPEAFLHEADRRGRGVQQAMSDYLQRNIFAPISDSFVLVERCTQSGARVGLVLLVDLEAYDYKPEGSSLIRATEQTVLERIPPRLALRERSSIELSHVLLIVDDPLDSVLGPLNANRQTLTKLYDMPLMMNGGHIKGWQVTDAGEQARLTQAFRALRDKLQPGNPLFFVGDGNHSLAAAKAYWEQQRARLAPQEQAHHPARFALAEMVNLHSPALIFKPIHRMVFGVSRQAVLDALKPLGPVAHEKAPDIVLVGEEKDMPLALNNAKNRLITEAVQQVLDEAAMPLDFVHGVQALREIAATQGGTGILMPDFPKDQLFPVVRKYGRLPRKTFSMGEANEKRFYLEARRIR